MKQPAAAIALVPHTGWTWLVRVDDDCVTARTRVVAVPVVEAELYHHAQDHAGDAKSRAAQFARERASALTAAIEATREHCAGARRAFVLGKQQVLPDLETIIGARCEARPRVTLRRA